MDNLLTWAKSLAMAWGGPGLFAIAFLDSSVLSLPEINDILVILFVMQHKELMLYYALMSTLGSVAGCFLVYGLGRTGGEALLRRRNQGKNSRTAAAFERYGLLAILVPAILPPPAPFKVFVLMAGVARMKPLTFGIAVALGRGLRYLVIGLLAVWYGEVALQYLRDNAQPAALVAGLLVLLGGVLYFYWSRRGGNRNRLADHTTASDSSTSSAC